jgi:YfiH family protein
MKNHEIFADVLGYDFRRLVFSDQVHDIRIKNVTKEDAGKGIIKESDIKGIDGLVTDVPGIPIITFYADCVPLYFYDPVKRGVALAHSGWRGTVKKIGAVMVKRMADDYGSNPSDIVCAIGPSICRSCYEVSSDVAEEFKTAYSEDVYNKIIDVKENGKFQLDLHLACYYNFLSAGITENHIAMPDICTCCNSSVLFSHRASGGKRGNLAAVAMIRE